MPLLMLKDVPRYECLLKAAERYPTMELSASETFLNLLRTADMMFAEKGRYLAKLNLSQGRFSVLMLLNNCCHGPTTPAALAEEAGVTRATMTGIIDTLERDGLVSREPDPHDRRIIRVQLTAAGEAFVEGMLPGWFACISSVIDPLDESERKTLIHLLHKIQTGLAPSQPLPTEVTDPVES
jgi:DNA-binding MarR family transcriptional regulator